MVTGVPGSPSAYTILPQDLEGLPPPHSGITAPPGTHILPSGAAQVSAEYPAWRQDFDLVDPQHDFLAITFDYDAFITSLDHANTEFSDPSRSGLHNGTGQSWANDTEADPGELSQPIAQLKRSKRTVSLSPPPIFVHKRPKSTHESFPPPNEELPASSRYDQSAERLMASQRTSGAAHVHAQLLEPPSTTLTITEEVQKSKRSLQCAFRKAQAKLGLPYTCTAAPVTTVSAVRTHLTRKLPKGRPPHLPFLKLCTTCNEDILDELEFKAYHSEDGLKCETPRQQRRGDAGQQEQYDILCLKVEAYIVTQRSRSTTTPSATAEHDATLLRSASHTNDPVLAPQLAVSIQTRSTVAVERPQSPTRSEESRHFQTAKENPIEGREWSCISMGLDAHTADRHSAVDKRAEPAANLSHASLTSSEHPGYQVVPLVASAQVSQTSNASREWQLGPDGHTLHIVDVGEEIQGQKGSSSVEIDEPMQQIYHQQHPHIPLHYQLFDTSPIQGLDIDRTYDPITTKPGTFSDVCPSLSDTRPSDSAMEDTTSELDVCIYAPAKSPQSTLRHTPSSDSYTIRPPRIVPSISPSTDMHQGLLVQPATPPLGPSSAFPTPPFSLSLPAPDHDSSATIPYEVRCDVEGCTAYFRGLYSKGNLARHKRHNHIGPKVYVCADDLCKRVFRRQDARLKHYRKHHSELVSDSPYMPRGRAARLEGGNLDLS